MKKPKTQKDKIRDVLLSGRSITPLQALRRFGCFRLGAVIHRLRHDEGLRIITERVRHPRNNKQFFARYRLRRSS